MSNQKIDAVTREAIWIAYGKRCVYTQEHIDLDSMQIDHVIPEYLLQEPQNLQELRTQLGLPDDFDLRGADNLVAARTRRNLQKGDLQLTAASLHFFLNIAASKKSAVEENIRKIKARLESGRALVLLQQMVEEGHLKRDHIASFLTKTPAEIFRLAETMRFSDETAVQTIEKSDLDSLRRRPVGLGGNTHLDGITLGNDTGEERHVRNCLEYEAALRDGYYARNTFEIKISVFFKHQCGLLAALARATLPVKSFISEPRVGLPDVHLLPFWLFPAPSAPADDPPPSEGPSYEDKIKAGELIVRRLGSGVLVVDEPAGMGQQLVEVVRADFDGDGLEEMLVFEYCYATHGTLGYGGIKLLSRKSSDGPFHASDIDA